jgi:hypothetical protein
MRKIHEINKSEPSTADVFGAYDEAFKISGLNKSADFVTLVKTVAGLYAKFA